MDYRELQNALRKFKEQYLTDIPLNSRKELLQNEYNSIIERLEIDQMMVELDGFTTEEVLEIVENIETYEQIIEEQDKKDEEIVEYFKGDNEVQNNIMWLLGYKGICKINRQRAKNFITNHLFNIQKEIENKADEIYTSLFDKEIELLNYCLSK